MSKMFYTGRLFINRILNFSDCLKNAKYIQDSIFNKLPVTISITDINQCLQEKEEWTTQAIQICNHH